MSEIARGHADICRGETGYPRGGYGRLIDEIAEVLEAHGGKLLTAPGWRESPLKRAA